MSSTNFGVTERLDAMNAPTQVTDTDPKPVREIAARRIRFRYPSGSLTHHYVTGGPYVQGDLVMSHIVSVLSATFPEGEEFFIRSVKNHSSAVTDPALKRNVRGFVGQEVIHGREHRELNAQLHEMGYPTEFVDRFTARLVKLFERFSPKMFPLAMTAALEHYTATLAELILGDERVRELMGDSEVRSVLLWHALEESEHKAVAFDVFQAAGGTERMRKAAMVFATAVFFAGAGGTVLVSLLGDRATYNPRRLARSVRLLLDSPFITKEVRSTLLDYMRTGFHPNDIDNSDLLDEWTPKLFGEEGSLVDRMTP